MRDEAGAEEHHDADRRQYERDARGREREQPERADAGRLGVVGDHEVHRRAGQHE